MRLLKLVPDDTNIDFLRWRKLASFMSFFLVAVSIALVAVKGLNLGVDFVGGQSVRVEFTQTMPPIDEIRERVGDIGLGEATIQQFGSDKAVSIRTALPEGDKTVVLGLITSKFPQLEKFEDVKARVEEASQYVPKDQLCLSPQCGFASTEEGNALTEEEQWAKVRLIRDYADKIWGE